jgi:hypothetical protein
MVTSGSVHPDQDKVVLSNYASAIAIRDNRRYLEKMSVINIHIALS